MSDLDEFKTEILETLDSAEKALLEFDQLPEATSSVSLYDEIFRAYHNIKGAAGMLDWHELQHHVHQLENVLMQTKATSSIPKKVISWFLSGNDVARQIIAGESVSFNYSIDSIDTIQSNNVVPLSSETQTKNDQTSPEFLAEMSEALDRITNSLLKIEAGHGDKELINSLYRETHSVKGAVQLFALEDASSLSHAMESALESYRGKEKVQIDSALSGTLLLCVDLLGQCINSPSSKDNAREVSFMINLLKPFIPAIGEIHSPDTQAHEVKEEVHSEAQLIKNADIKEVKASAVHTEAKSAQETQDKADSTIRVQVSLLDKVMTLMGEMVLVRNQILQYSNKTDDLEFSNLSQKLDVVTSELQEETMKTRMQPIGNILSKFQRVVRDLSGTLSKKINLNLVGTETELDKTLLEAVKDPLTHIVRNACDHGIESPEERLKSGKSESGTITIQAFHEGGQVIVEISDDGKGLSRKKLLSKAIEKGLINSDKADEMNDRDVQALIFAPGFSTAEKITNVSGRGVGMDVVKSNIEKIGGLVDISSQEGFGTKITLKVPLTLAIVPALIVKCSDERYAIPQMKLSELLRIEGKSVEYIQGKPVHRLRGNVLSLIDLREVLLKDDRPELKESDVLNVVVLKSQESHFGLVVDEIIDTTEIVVKPLASFLKPLSIYSGATVLGDGSVALILDVHGIALEHLMSTVDHDSRSGAGINGGESDFNDREVRELVIVQTGATAKHAIPLSVVNRMEEFKRAEIEFSGTQKVVRYRGGVLRLISLNDFFKYENVSSEKDITQVVVVNIQDQMFGFEVDQIIDVLSSYAPFDDSLDDQQGIAGNLVTPSEIIVVIDPAEIVDSLRPADSRRRSGDFGGQGHRILLVEDTESIRNKVADVLRGLGHTVMTGSDGVDGLKKIADNKFGVDLIISDIEMPKMNGFEFARKVKSIEAMKNVPLIAFTTKNQDKDIREAKMAGFDSFLEKGKIKILPLLINEFFGVSKRKSA